MVSKVPTLDIIIVNWNAGDLLRNCLASIEKADKTNFCILHVFVVDNFSTDNSLDKIEKFNLPLTVIRNIKNIGFAAACNQVAKNSSANYLLFLNPDIQLCEESLVKPIIFMENTVNKNIGICGIQLIDKNGKITRSCTRFPNLKHFIYKIIGLDYLFPHTFRNHFMNECNHSENRDVDHVSGAFFLVKRKLFNQLKGFDDNFFVYLEDLDFSYRAHKLGWSSFYLASTHAHHIGGGTSEKIKSTRLFYSLQSKIIYGFKHFNLAAAIILMIMTILIEPITRLVKNIRIHSIKETLQGYIKLWSALPILIKTCNKVRKL